MPCNSVLLSFFLWPRGCHTDQLLSHTSTHPLPTPLVHIIGIFQDYAVGGVKFRPWGLVDLKLISEDLSFFFFFQNPSATDVSCFHPEAKRSLAGKIRYFLG